MSQKQKQKIQNNKKCRSKCSIKTRISSEKNLFTSNSTDIQLIQENLSKFFIQFQSIKVKTQ